MAGTAETFIFGISILILCIAIAWLIISYRYKTVISKEIFGRGFNGVFGDTIKMFCPSDRTICIADAKIIDTSPKSDNTEGSAFDAFSKDGSFNSVTTYDATDDFANMVNGKTYYEFTIDANFINTKNFKNFFTTSRLSSIGIKNFQIIGTYNCIPKGALCGANIDRKITMSDIVKNPRCGILNQRAVGSNGGVPWSAVCAPVENPTLKCDPATATDPLKPYCWITQPPIDRGNSWNCTRLNSVSTDGKLCENETSISYIGQILCTPDAKSNKYCWRTQIPDTTSCTVDTSCDLIGQMCNDNMVCSTKDGPTCKVTKDAAGNLLSGCWRFMDGYTPPASGTPSGTPASGTSSGTPSGTPASGTSGTSGTPVIPPSFPKFCNDAKKFPIFKYPYDTNHNSTEHICVDDVGKYSQSYCKYDRNPNVYSKCDTTGLASECNQEYGYTDDGWTGGDHPEMSCRLSGPYGPNSGYQLAPGPSPCKSGELQIFANAKYSGGVGVYTCVKIDPSSPDKSNSYCKYSRNPNIYGKCDQAGNATDCNTENGYESGATMGANGSWQYYDNNGDYICVSKQTT